MDKTEQFPLIAKTMAELEDVLAEELIGLGANDVEIGTRMVSFTGNKALMYKANLHCRTALRILKPIYTFKAENADQVYEAIKQLDWEEYLSLDNTFSIDAVVFSHIFHHSKFVAYRVKDAIADWFTEKYDKRPSVGVTNPDLVFNIHIAHNKCTLSLDSSGESLHKRGYRVEQTEAPLSEVLAAGMILKSGWRGESTFIDPMCGSGTLLIEAAMIALGTPPGIHRQHFAFEKWNDFDEDLFSEIYNDDSTAREFKHRIIGSDISPKAIAITEKNIKNAGLKKYIDLSVLPFQQYIEAPASEGVLMTNPPYGERLKVDELETLYAMIGERLKHVFTGYTAYVLSYRKESFDAIGLKHSNRFFLYNGALECEMREYEIFSGKRYERRESDTFREKTFPQRCTPLREELERGLSPLPTGRTKR
jgi:Predicted N6-adenine-specific DNA methylase